MENICLKQMPHLEKCCWEDASAFRKEISSCVEACVVENATSVFLPPYASLNATPYPSMVASYEASYANFRFFSESLLADVLPRRIENGLLDYHNKRRPSRRGVTLAGSS